MQESTAVTIARAHINAWSHQDWEKTRELVAPNVHVVATSTQSMLPGGEASGIDNYMERLIKTVQFIEPGSVQVISAIGDERNALVLETLRIGLGPGGTMVTLARASLYLLDESKKIIEERDEFCVLSH
ncbi:nuclear transport factor 2 family protein [Ktedonobacter robiniae]|nr:nuclear transport factor 2 family protein [Ktedonobacter robiniae]